MEHENTNRDLDEPRETYSADQPDACKGAARQDSALTSKNVQITP